MERSQPGARTGGAGTEATAMKWWIGAGAALAVAVLAGPGQAQEEAPKVGDKAPDFKLTASDGKEYSLSQFQGKSAVVIAWYPKALTGG